jgi:hypothetical protein
MNHSKMAKRDRFNSLVRDRTENRYPLFLITHQKHTTRGCQPFEALACAKASQGEKLNVNHSP